VDLIHKHIDAIKKLCVEHKVAEMYVFGSVLSKRFTVDSDVDFLIKFSGVNSLEYFDNYMDLKEKLEKTLSRKVDLVEIQTIKNPILKRSIDREKKYYMDEKILKWLYDIKGAIDEIEGYFTNFPKDFEHYKSNIILKRAVERDLEIIGEAVNRIIKRDPDFPIENAVQISWIKKPDYSRL